MKWILCLLPFFFIFSSRAQEKESFLLKGIILSYDSVAVEDAYVINFRDAYMYNSNRDGRFNIWVLPGDSLIISHISFMRKKIYADSVRLNPYIFLEFDTMDIRQVDIMEKPADERANLKKNMAQMMKSIQPSYKDPKIKYENYDQFLSENNRVFRNEVNNVTFTRFSPSALIGKLVKKRKASNNVRINSTRQEKQPPAP